MWSDSSAFACTNFHETRNCRFVTQITYQVKLALLSSYGLGVCTKEVVSDSMPLSQTLHTSTVFFVVSCRSINSSLSWELVKLLQD